MKTIGALFAVLAVHEVMAAGGCWNLKASGDGVPAEYYQERCYAEAAVSRGDLRSAAAHYRAALKIHLFEAPNYELKLPLGKVLCSQQRFDEGRAVLDEFMCLANADLGNLECPVDLKDIPNTECMHLACDGYGSALSDKGRKTRMKELAIANKRLKACHAVQPAAPADGPRPSGSARH